MASLSLPHAGAWLTVVPNPHMGLHLNSPEFVVCLKYRLGIPIYPEGLPYSGCSTREAPVIMDAKGDHAMNCGFRGGRVSQHNALRNVIASTAASHSPRVELLGLVQGGNQKPRDIFIAGWPMGRDTALDVTVVNLLEAKYLVEVGITMGAGLTGACRTKRGTAGPYIRGTGLSFQVMTFKSFSRWHEEALVVLKRIASILSRNNRQHGGQAVRHCTQWVVMALQKGVASILTHRLPAVPPE